MKKVHKTSLVFKKNVIYETNVRKYSLRSNLFMEWAIWSKCFGKVLVINGASSSGKTTLCKYLSKFGFNTVSIDEVTDEVLFDFFGKFTKNILLVRSFLTDNDMTKILHGYKVGNADYSESQLMILKVLQDEINHILERHFPSQLEIYNKIYDKSKKYIFSGQNVVIDIVAKGDSIDMLSYCFGYYPMKIGLLYSSLEENLMKCFKRNYISSKTDTSDCRYPAVIVDQYTSFYTFVVKNSVSKKDKVIEIIDKNKARAILEVAKCFDYNLFLYLKEKLYSEMDYYHSKMSHSDVITWMHGKVNKIESDMMLDAAQEVCVLPKVRCDFVLKSSFLKCISDFIGGDDYHDQIRLPSTTDNTQIDDIEEVFYCNLIIHDNPILNDQKIGELFKLTKSYFGMKGISKLIDIGLILYKYQIFQNLRKELGDEKAIKLYLNSELTGALTIDLSVQKLIELEESSTGFNNLVSAQNISSVLLSMQPERIVDRLIVQNFFFNNEKGKAFIQIIYNNFDENTLLAILELGRDQDITDQIIEEAEIQGIDKIVYTLLGKEPLVTGITNNLENILGTTELNQLRLIPNGILNNWSNKAYQKVAEYIDYLAKDLDDLLNAGIFGNKVAINIALLESLLGFEASGRKFTGGVPSYHDPSDGSDWPDGSGSSYDGRNSVVNSNEFASLILPLYNSTGYTTDYQDV